MHILVTFLGGVGKYSAGGGGRAYQEAAYDFKPTPITKKYFGLALLEHLQRSGDPVDKVVVIGTRGSFWDNLVRLLIPDPDEAGLTELGDKAEKDEIKDDDLDAWRDRLKSRMHEEYGVKAFETVILDHYAITAKQQLRLIKLIDGLTDGGRAVTFDITHGLRHLPILNLVAALVVSGVRDIPIKIYYGAHDRRDRTNGKTPVLELDGLLNIGKWLAAFNTYDKDGDYAVFAPLIEKTDSKRADLLREAAYHESIGDFAAAADDIRRYKDLPTESAAATPLVIFHEALQRRFSWAGDNGLYRRQRTQALAALERHDFLRAALWGVEAVISRLALRTGREAENPGVREEIKNNWSGAFTRAGLSRQERAFSLLRRLRNRLAHGAVDDGGQEVREATKTRQACLETLDRCLKELLPEDPRQPLR